MNRFRMDKKSTPVGSNALGDTKELVAALPDVPKEQRPKYVQKSEFQLQEKSSATSSASVGSVSSAGAPAAKNPTKRGNYRNNTRAPLTDGKRPAFKPFLRRQEVVELPSDVPTQDYLISADNVIFFSGPAHYLSALYPISVNVDGNEYNSVEHYYQACKLYTLVGKESAAELKTASTPIDVKKATKAILKGKVSPKLVNEWKNKDSIAILKHAITQKFIQHEDLKKALLDTGDKLLVQTYIGDNFFAAGANVKYATGWVARHLNQSLKIPKEVSAENFKYLPNVANGKNGLGWILMEVRRELRSM